MPLHPSVAARLHELQFYLKRLPKSLPEHDRFSVKSLSHEDVDNEPADRELMLDKDIDLSAPLLREFLASNGSSKDAPSSVNVAVQVQPKVLSQKDLWDW
ncbi:hypothetical protein M422DRAFT_247086 [Sphaerobolus stellatus SS14]|nr:hypothetical protein M422DRAFT_247086 [Sphaerobolus stellatus SS14]